MSFGSSVSRSTSRSVELARIRRDAIEEARDQLGGSYTEVARAFGLTKSRITQIRSSAPPAHRAFFGVGPLDIALPGRRIFGRDDLSSRPKTTRSACTSPMRLSA